VNNIVKGLGFGAGVFLAVFGIIRAGEMYLKPVPDHPGAIVCAIDGHSTTVIPYDNAEYLRNGDWELKSGVHSTVFKQSMLESCIAIPDYKIPPPQAQIKKPSDIENHAHWEHKLPYYDTQVMEFKSEQISLEV
jgi:hypothetical protein